MSASGVKKLSKVELGVSIRDCLFGCFLCVLVNSVFASQFDGVFEEAFPKELPDVIPDSKLNFNSILPQNNLGQQSTHTYYLFKQYRITGKPLVNKDLIDALVAPYLNQLVLDSDLIQLLNEITQLYIAQGYINSGVILQTDKLSSETLMLKEIAGTLSDIEIKNEGRFKEAYFIRRLGPPKGDAVNLKKVERQLQKIKNMPQVKKVNASFVPDQMLGEGVLRLTVEENKPYRTSVALNNYGTTAVGEEQLNLTFTHLNVSGYGDTIDLFYQKNKHRDGYGISYGRGLGSGDISWDIAGSRTETQYGLGQANQVLLSTESDTFSLGLKRQYDVDIGKTHELSSRLEWIETKSLINDIFPLQIIADDKGISKVLALRLGHLWSYRSFKHAFSLKTSLSYGENHSDSIDAFKNKKFKGFHIQSQWARRVDHLNSQLNVMLELKKTDSELFPSELLSVGGHSNLRGYREGELAAQSGAIASLEWRFLGSQMSIIPKGAYLGFFYDSTRLQDTAGFQNDDTYDSYGISVYWEFIPQGVFTLDVANRLQGDNSNKDLQGQGVHASLRYSF